MYGPRDIDAATAKEFSVEEDPDRLPLLECMQPVGVVHSPYRNHFSTPRQPGTNDDPVDGWIILRKGMQNCIRDLQGFSHIWVIFWLSYSRGWKPMVIPPRDSEHRGVFSTRSPHRPNPIGLSCVRMLNAQGLKILVRDHDFLHGTPVLDIKPYIPEYDAHPQAKGGWVHDLKEPGPDHRWR
jgi:tRNA-Thr(GGU) m(6)t(6)A37 methyltransferase TsaA